MKITKLFSRIKSDKDLPTVVVFTGGMGTQIIQAATFFYLRNSGQPVYADLSYFDVRPKMASPGNAGQLTHWFWQLDQLGLPKSSFEQLGDNPGKVITLRDGPKMMELGLKALSTPEVRLMFGGCDEIAGDFDEDLRDNFICIHIRRGDYVNVASHLISDLEFIQLLSKFSGLFKHAVFLSDSPISENFRDQVSPLFDSSLFMDNIDPYLSHRIMRKARILICSNSTFSLTAAMLNPKALVIIPKKWFSEKDHAIEAPIHARSTFQIMG